MIRHYEQTKSGYSSTTSIIYYLCESEEEYNELINNFSEKKNNEWYCVYVDTPISCRPTTVCSDGYCTRGGRIIDAIGITEISTSVSPNGISHTNIRCYIKPGTMTKNEVVKTESWWA